MPVERVVSASARTAPGKPALLPALTLVPDIRKSVYAKTQKEVRKKMTVGQWLDVWAAEYLGGVKPMTVLNYSQHIKNHIKPAMGAIITSAIRRSELIASEYSKKRNPPRLLMALIMLMCIFLAWTFTTGVFPFGA